MIKGSTRGFLRLAAGLALVSSIFCAPVLAGDVASSVDVKVWGRAVFNAHYDTSILAKDYISWGASEDAEELTFNPRDTRFGVAASQTDGDWTYRGVFEIDFYGDNAGNNLIPRLRLGYAEARNASGFTFRAGQDWMPLMQQNPSTVDFGILSWSGNLWWRVPQVTVRFKTGSVEYLATAFKHRNSNDQEMAEKMPWLGGRVAMSDVLGAGSLVAVNGGFRSVSVDDNDYSAYVAGLELRVPLGDTGMTLNGEAYMGQGVGREFVHYGFDYNPAHPDGPTEVASKGGFVSLKVPASSKVDVNVGFGMDDPDDDDLTGGSAQFAKNTTAFGNFKVKVTKQFGWGCEAVHFNTEALGGDEVTGQRFTSSWWFIF